MTDPRLAPLTAALSAHLRTFTDGSWLLLFDDKGYPQPSIEKFAAAILVALPDDWCGHEAEALDREAFIGRQRAEIVRLRKIEHAARELIANTEVGAWPVSDALRAALDGTRPVNHA